MAEGGSESIITDLQKEIECSICFEQIANARLLNCLHTFCEECLVNVHRRGAITCPVCQTTTKLPEQGVQGLSPNFFFNRIVDIVKTQNESAKPTGGSVCSNCESGETVRFYCFDCKHFLCGPCTDYHNKMKLLTSGHHVVELTNFSSEDYRDFIGRPGDCEVHKKEELKFFCEECKQCICMTCTVVEHRNHKCLYLEEAVSVQKKCLKQMMKEVEENNSQLATKSQDIKERSLRIQQDAEQTKNALKASTNKLMQMIRDHVEKVEGDINKEVNEELNSICKLQSHISTKKSKMEDCLKFAEDVIERGCPPEIMELKGILGKRIQDLETEAASGQSTVSSVHMSYRMNDGVIDALQTIGHVQKSSTWPESCTFEGDCLAHVGRESRFYVITRNENGEITHVENDFVAVELKNNVSADIPVNINGNGSGRYTVSFVPASVGRYSVNIYVNGKNINCQKVLCVQSIGKSTRRKGITFKKIPTGQSSSSSKTKKSDDKCVICIEAPTNPVTLDKCGHTFCRDCIDQAFSHRKVCPTCGTVYGMLTGNQPTGTMNWTVDTYTRLPGYERYGTITINYFFPAGIQGPEHPTPGQRYNGTSRTAFLPDCPEGKEVLKLLKRAFDARLIFTIGTSVTTGIGNVVTWNDIHHKTNIYGGSTGYGYPDPTYLSRVKEELAAKGIV